MSIEVKEIVGLVPIDWRTKLSPVWWFGNVDDPVPNYDYMVGAPEADRARSWFWRNFSHNLTCYVIGVKGRDRVIYGSAPIEHGGLKDVGCVGVMWKATRVGWLWLPYLSHASARLVLYVGWRFNGGSGIKFNVHDSSVQAF